MMARLPAMPLFFVLYIVLVQLATLVQCSSTPFHVDTTIGKLQEIGAALIDTLQNFSGVVKVHLAFLEGGPHQVQTRFVRMMDATGAAVNITYQIHNSALILQRL